MRTVSRTIRGIQSADGADAHSTIMLTGRAASSRAIIVAARSLRETIARYGPFVVNTPAQIAPAMDDFRPGRF